VNLAKFLDTSGVSYYLQRVIDNAQKFLILVSPYLKVNSRIKELLFEKDKVGIKIFIIYGKEELKPQEWQWLKSLSNIRIKFCKNLHAKCYISESGAIVTSMNLYDFSEINNKEMGILILNEDSDRALYSSVSKEVRRLLENSEEILLSALETEENIENQTEIKQAKKREIKRTGFCIACGKELELNLRKPYCLACYRQRNFHKQTYIESYCHLCGCEYKTSLAKTMCRQCYKAF